MNVDCCVYAARLEKRFEDGQVHALASEEFMRLARRLRNVSKSLLKMVSLLWAVDTFSQPIARLGSPFGELQRQRRFRATQVKEEPKGQVTPSGCSQQRRFREF